MAVVLELHVLRVKIHKKYETNLSDIFWSEIYQIMKLAYPLDFGQKLK